MSSAVYPSKNVHLAILCGLFEMIKWQVKWPPTGRYSHDLNHLAILSFSKNKGKTPQETSSLNHPKWVPLDFQVIPPWHQNDLKGRESTCLKRKHLKNKKGKPPQFIQNVSITKNGGGWNNPNLHLICHGKASLRKTEHPSDLRLALPNGFNYPTEVVGWIYGDTWLGFKKTNKGTLTDGDKNRIKKKKTTQVGKHILHVDFFCSNAWRILKLSWNLPGWWLNQPFWKICASQNGSCVQVVVKIKKKETTTEIMPRYSLFNRDPMIILT